MKTLRIAACILLFTTAVFAQSDAQKSFDQLKSLAGSWEGKSSQGEPVQVTFSHDCGKIRVDERNRGSWRKHDLRD